MTSVEIISFADRKQLENINKELGEDVDRLENRREIFKQWVDCEKHMPKDVDQRIIDNFIRLSKFEIERAKTKFEMWLYARTKYTNLYTKPPIHDRQFSSYRHIIISKDLTMEGYKLLMARFKDLDVDNLDVEQILQYCFMYYEYFLLRDICCGYVFIFDLSDVTAQMLGKIPILLFKTAIDLITKVHPQRIRQIHVINLPTIAQGLFTLAKKLISAKLRKRILSYKDVSAISSYIRPSEILPNEFGGNSGKFYELAENAKAFLANEDKFQDERETWILAGDLPTEKTKMYSFEDNGVAGSFRKLQID